MDGVLGYWKQFGNAARARVAVVDRSSLVINYRSVNARLSRNHTGSLAAALLALLAFACTFDACLLLRVREVSEGGGSLFLSQGQCTVISNTGTFCVIDCGPGTGYACGEDDRYAHQEGAPGGHADGAVQPPQPSRSRWKEWRDHGDQYATKGDVVPAALLLV